MTQDSANLISIISDIRDKSGVGAKPMLGELADAIALAISQAYEQGQRDMRERAAITAEMHEHRGEIAAAIRSLPIEQERKP